MRNGIVTIGTMLLSYFIASYASANGLHSNGNESKSENTVIVPGSTEVTIVDPSMIDNSDTAIYLRDIEANEYESRDIQSGYRISLKANKLGKLEKSILQKKDSKASHEISKFLSKQELIVGKAKDYIYEIDRVTEIGEKTYVHFHQVIDSLELPPSRISLDKNQEAFSFELVSANPSNDIFNKESWLSEGELLDLAKASYEASYGAFSSESVDDTSYQVLFNDTATRLVVALEMSHEDYRISIDVASGEVLFITKEVAYATRRCDNNGTTNAERDCDHSQTTIFYNNGCVGGSSRCSDPDVSDLNLGILTSEFFTTGNGQPGTTNFDVVFDTVHPNYILAGFRRFSGRNVIGLGPDWSSASSSIRQEVAAHEWGHLWHRHQNTTAYNYTSYFSGAVKESFADLIRGFSTLDPAITMPSGWVSRNLDNNLKWTNFVNQANKEHANSQIISELFWEIWKGLGSTEGLKLFFYMADNQDNAKSSAPGGYTIDDFKLTLRDYLYSSLNSSQRSTVCSIWTSRTFPDSPCKVPGKPSWFTATNLGTCGWTYVPSQGGYAYGSSYSFNWANVSREDYFNLCWSTNPFSGYICDQTFAKNDTSSLPVGQIVVGNIYVGSQGCNESGCGSLTAAAASSTCTQ